LNEHCKNNQRRQYPFGDLAREGNQLRRTEFRLGLGLSFGFNLGRVDGRRYFRLRCREMLRAGHFKGSNIFYVPTDDHKYSLVFAGAEAFLADRKTTLE
jgi:hypothetical protein